MDQIYLRILVNVDQTPPRSVVLENVSGQETAARLIQFILAKLGLSGPSDWSLVYQGREFPLDAPIGLWLGSDEGTVELLLRKIVVPSPQTRALIPPPAPAAAPPPPTRAASPAPASSPGAMPKEPQESGKQESIEEESVDLDSEHFDLCLEDSDEAGGSADSKVKLDVVALEEDWEGASASRAKKPARARTQALQSRRATVRYYSRMNPERLYPLLLILSREMVAEIKKKHVAQRGSQAFSVAEDLPIEVEPILPGCDCYPPKMVTKLSQADQTLTFRVVPRVLGKIEGAAVVIRQDHATLASIDLEMKVVKRTWVVVWGLITFLLPALSTALQYLGLDFSAQGQGFNLYLSLAQFLFELVPPFWLTVGLALVTAIAFWLTRPVGRDVFWDVQTLSLAGRLKQIEKTLEENPAEGRKQLTNFLEQAPDYQPVHLLSGKWHYQSKQYGDALRCFQQAFRLGDAQATHYQMASLAASRLGKNSLALQILQTAEEALTPQRIPGILVFNMGCYHTRLGNLDAAMDCLKRAVRRGFRKVESFTADADLNPLRGRSDFRALVSSLKEPALKPS